MLPRLFKGILVEDSENKNDEVMELKQNEPEEKD